MRQVQTTGVDLLGAAFKALSEEEQEEALKLCQAIWLQREIERGGTTAQLLTSLRRVAEILGYAPGIDDYKRVRAELAKDGEQLEPVSRITKRFDGSWYVARQALDLSEATSARKIEARFKARRRGKVWRYSEETLRQAMADCVESIGHVPQVAEYDWWRQCQIELALARGEELHLPSPTAFRRPFKTWQAALIRFGYSAATSTASSIGICANE